MNYIYKSESDIIIEIHNSIIKNIQKECTKSKNYETGGILIGKYSSNGKIAIISDYIKAPKDSKREMYTFYRGILGLETVIDKFWRSKKYYLGEWHYHPNSSPEPSFIDIKQMKEISKNKDVHCPEPILLIIGGNNNMGWQYSINVVKDSQIIKFTKIKNHI